MTAERHDAPFAGDGFRAQDETAARSASARPEVMEPCDAAAAGVGNAAEKLELVMGAEGLARLASAHVAVLGLGGVGSNCVEALARGGVGNLFLVDRDRRATSTARRSPSAARSGGARSM